MSYFKYRMNVQQQQVMRNNITAVANTVNKQVVNVSNDIKNGISLPLSNFMSQFAFAVSLIAMFVYIFVNKNVKITEMFWHIMFMGTFIWNTECLSSDKKCSIMAGLSMIYPIIYLTTFTYFNVANSIQESSSEKRNGLLDETA